MKNRLFLWAGLLLGLGLGGFFDGIVIHQILQWHHMLTSAGYPPDSVANLQVNTLADGLFHVGTYVLTLAGVLMLWRSAREGSIVPRLPLLLAAMLAGWGLFNLAEGLVNHYILQIHHVRDDLPDGAARQVWDLGFLLWGAIMAGGGWLWIRSITRRESVPAAARRG